ncbi:hypothetical protein PCANC_09410 [Puccinia coronata f. sp. avenae]|uniref:Uncharacterized protein n=1 Tax=Puccinia coronata f. sp. avenae TaxID=200324 RepID=A0A2N5VDC8_9BASI|nr:hypothetical protein PCANC_09410 [Puccinia coronata f. sp. avenae]
MQAFKSHLLPILTILSLISSYRAPHVHHRLQPRSFSGAIHIGEGISGSRGAGTAARGATLGKDAGSLAQPVGHGAETVHTGTGAPPIFTTPTKKLDPLPQPKHETPALGNPALTPHPTPNDHPEPSFNPNKQPPPTHTSTEPHTPPPRIRTTLEDQINASSRKWNDPTGRFLKAWKNAQTTFKSYQQNTQKAIMEWVYKFQARWRNQLPQALGKFKAQFGRPAEGATTVRSTSRFKELTGATSERLKKIRETLIAFKQNTQETILKLWDQVKSLAGRLPGRNRPERVVPTKQELTEFRFTKMRFAHAFSHKANHRVIYTLGNGKEFTPHNFAEILKARLLSRSKDASRKKLTFEEAFNLRQKANAKGKPAGTSTGKPDVVSPPYEEYLNALHAHYEADSTMKDAQTALAWRGDLDSGDKIAVDSEVFAEIDAVYREPAKAKVKEFQLESQSAIKSLSETKNLPKKPEAYFQDFRLKNYGNFPEARTIQLSDKTPKQLANPTFSTVEEVVHALPAELDLTTEIYRYSLIQDFESLLDDLKWEAEGILNKAASPQLSRILQDPSYLRPQLESYVNKLGEDDFARLFEEHPSAIYNQLTTLAQDSDRIPYALNTYQNALSKDDYEALKEASANRRVFRKKLQEIRDRIGAKRGFFKKKLQQQDLDILTNLEKDAVNANPNNYPYAEELYQRYIIDDATRAKLTAEGTTRAEFLKIIGTQEDFTQTLMADFREKVLGDLRIPVDGHDKLIQDAAENIAKSYLEPLDKEAKSFYLTKEAFVEPDSMKFDKAVEVYNEKIFKDPSSIKINDDLIAKAYVEAYLPSTAHPELTIKKLLDEVRLKGTHPAPVGEGLHDVFPDFDYRLAEFKDNPLVKNDPRLKGTRWESLTDDSRIKLNKAASELFTKYDLFASTARDYSALASKVKTYEEELSEDIPGILQIMEEVLAKAVKKPDPVEPSLDGLNAAWKERHDNFAKGRAKQTDEEKARKAAEIEASEKERAIQRAEKLQKETTEREMKQRKQKTNKGNNGKKQPTREDLERAARQLKEKEALNARLKAAQKKFPLPPDPLTSTESNSLKGDETDGAK